MLFVVGLAGVVVLTVAWLQGYDPNYVLAVMFATMMGLPAFLQADEKRKDEKDGDGK